MHTHPRSSFQHQPGVRSPLSMNAAAVDRSAHKILLPIDGSLMSDAAVEHVANVFGSQDVKVFLVNVQSPVESGGIARSATAKLMAELLTKAGEQALKRASGYLGAMRVEYDARVVFGPTVDAIVRCASDLECDAIVMATRNTGCLGALFCRSTAHRVLRRATVPVTIVKAAAEEGRPRLSDNDSSPLGLIELFSGRKRTCSDRDAYRPSLSGRT